MLNWSIKNFFKYKWFLSRSWFLLSLIAIFLTFISFFKGIQILMFIPAFVLSIFLYSILENYFILKNFRLNFYSDKTWNNLKIFVKKWYKYNFIIWNVKQNWEIEFLEVWSPLKFTLNKNEKYDLILYLYWSFDIFRKIINIWKVRFNNDNETYEFYLSEKYSEDKNMQHLDNLKTSINNIPYIKEKKEIVFKKDNWVEFNIVSNENLRIVWDEKISAIHFLMVIFAFIGIVIEWEDIILNSLMIIWFIIVFFLRNKRWKIKNIFKNVFLILAFILMIFMTLKNQDMSWPWSVFLVHILTIVYLYYYF